MYIISYQFYVSFQSFLKFMQLSTMTMTITLFLSTILLAHFSNAGGWNAREGTGKP